MSVNPSTIHKHGSGFVKALFTGCWGIFLGIFWIAALTLQIETTEVFILRGSRVSLVPNFAILYQPIDFIHGKLDAQMNMAVLFGWGIEIAFLTAFVFYEVAHGSVKSSNKHLANWSKAGMIIVVLFDCYCDFMYAPSAGFIEQTGFMLVAAFVVGFFGIWSIGLIEEAISHWV